MGSADNKSVRDWQCGVQPWSRGPAGSNLPLTEREYQARKARKARSSRVETYERLKLWMVTLDDSELDVLKSAVVYESWRRIKERG